MSKTLSSLAALRAAAAAGQGPPTPLTIQPVAQPIATPAPLPANPAADEILDPTPQVEAYRPTPRDPAPPALVTNQRRRQSPVAPSREGLVAVTVHMRPEGRRVLKQLAAETDKTVDELGRMAFNMLLTHYQKPRLI
jgi:hypothetical protein